ncbi:hypothetical protein HPB51_007371 [Rhipicephalus microplus]|uniref:Uncharacterized protein n=1 Tax=Rhipicephalus microplus TaxID=6941 RepID=A0A9J6E803_RHIMP|nr:hypothetical protein HPB51_007371 [Rhipicephalus microplus]
MANPLVFCAPQAFLYLVASCVNASLAVFPSLTVPLSEKPAQRVLLKAAAAGIRSRNLQVSSRATRPPRRGASTYFRSRARREEEIVSLVEPVCEANEKFRQVAFDDGCLEIVKSFVLSSWLPHKS